MTTIDERVAYLEGKVEEHSKAFGELRAAIRQVDGRIVALDEKLDRLVSGLEAKMEQRFAAIDQRFSGNDQRFNSIEQRFVRLDDKMSRQFLWILGVQIAVLIAVIGALAGR